MRGRHRRGAALAARLGLDSPDAIRRKANFGLVGFAGVIVSFGSLWLLIDWLHINHVVAYGLQTVLAIETNFILNDRYTWGDRHQGRPFLRRAARFHATRIGLMIPVNQVLFAFLQPSIGTTLANATCLAATTIANWFLNDRLVFRVATREPTLKEAS